MPSRLHAETQPGSCMCRPPSQLRTLHVTSPSPHPPHPATYPTTHQTTHAVTFTGAGSGRLPDPSRQPGGRRLLPGRHLLRRRGLLHRLCAARPGGAAHLPRHRPAPAGQGKQPEQVHARRCGMWSRMHETAAMMTRVHACVCAGGGQTCCVCMSTCSPPAFTCRRLAGANTADHVAGKVPACACASMSLLSLCCRLERWMDAALARPSAQQTKPADDVIVAGWGKFVAPLKQAA